LEGNRYRVSSEFSFFVVDTIAYVHAWDGT